MRSHKTCSPVKGNARGHTLWELVLALSISSIITVSGTAILQDLLRVHRQAERASASELKLQYWVADIQSAMDSRNMNPFSNLPWLTIHAEEGNQWYPLNQIEIQIIDVDQIRQWAWEPPENARVLSNRSTGEYYQGELPDSLILRFPDSDIPRYHDGIAIEGI